MEFQGLHEPQMADDNTRPGDETGDRGDVHEPIKSLTATCRQVEESQQSEQGSAAHGDVRGAVLVCLGHELGNVLLISKCDEDAAAGVDVRLGGRQNGGKQNGVEDIGEYRDASEVASNDQGRSRGVA